VNRRQFLFLSSVAAVAGCNRRQPGTPAVPPVDAAEAAAQRAARDTHLELLQRFRVPPGATRTTPPPPADVLAVAPELKGLIKVTLRLHPRYSEEPKAEESKLGGRFRWPAGEPWPTCAEHAVPLAPVLQLRAEDAPPQFAFFPDTDLLQLFWCPRDHDGAERLRPKLVWRKQSATAAPFADDPYAARPDGVLWNYVPVPCRLFPERVAEYPNWDTLPESVRQKIAKSDKQLHGAELYQQLLSVADGSKVGGWAPGAEPPTCPKCKWGMDYLLTVADAEWTERDWKRWMPTEERGHAWNAVEGYRRAAGLGVGRVLVFVCRRCEGWPASAIVA
jgi:hypothetical protein